MTMDDTASLVSELLTKLDELEQKVVEHRQNMALKFQQYSRNLLQNVSKDMSERVEGMIRDTMRHYPALRPALHYANPITNESPRLPDDSQDQRCQGRGSPPPVLPHTSGIPPENGSRSPHEREREFHGLFTPSYLPLLDSRDTPSPPTSPQVLNLLRTPLPDKELPQKKQPDSPSGPPQVVRRPTSETVSSVASNDSSSKTRKSSLRRSSGSSAKTHSPRRVRFDVEGQEVFPTASPPLSPQDHDFLTAPVPPSIEIPKDSRGIESYDQDSGLLGSSPPRPKKITSTDRLKALARSSKEDTSKWTVFGGLQGINEAEGDNIFAMAGSNDKLSTLPGETTKSETHSQSTTHINDVQLEHIEQREDIAVDNDDEDEDLLEMPKLSSFKGKKKFSPPDPTSPSHTGSKASNSTISTAKAPKENLAEDVLIWADAVDEDEDLFGYEPDQEECAKGHQLRGDSEPASKYIEVEEDDAVHEDSTANVEETPTTTLYSTSPAVPIAKSASPEAPATPLHYISGSVGSYKGRPFTFPTVRDPELHRKAVEMGDFYTFVGSVDGRSGVDDSTNYQPEMTYFNGTPKSLSERLMMEDFQEVKRNETNGGGTA